MRAVLTFSHHGLLFYVQCGVSFRWNLCRQGQSGKYVKAIYRRAKMFGLGPHWHNATLDEDLIKYGLEEDVWFHADKLSSAHIYLRMKEGESWESIDEGVLTDCAQLTKANSIEGPFERCPLRTWRDAILIFFKGNKKDNVTIIYTPWSNLKKDGSMAVGQVGFKDPRKVRLCRYAAGRCLAESISS